jgi:hypothetical protein
LISPFLAQAEAKEIVGIKKVEGIGKHEERREN